MITLIYGLQVMIVGVLIVFAGLTILIGCIKGMEKVLERLPEWKQKLPTAQVSQVKERLAAAAAQLKGNTTVNPNKATTENTDELVAVITAAVAAMMAQEAAQAAASVEGEEPAVEEVKGFVVRSIRRVSNASAWNRAGREEQIYSRL